jgi:hypothetical protein
MPSRLRYGSDAIIRFYLYLSILEAKDRCDTLSRHEEAY